MAYLTNLLAIACNYQLGFLDNPYLPHKLIHVVTDYIPILIVLVLSIGLAGALLGLSSLLGPKRFEKGKLSPYECGVPPVGDAREKFSVKYYLIAALFILFDVEIVFLFAWAVVFKKLGVLAFIEIIAFFAVILAGYFYIIKKEVLEWE